MSYQDFLVNKTQIGADHGFDLLEVPDKLFPFQRSLLEWLVLKGRSACYANCGLGKTALELAWARNVNLHTGKPTLILTPLAVSSQTIREGEKFGIECQRSSDGTVYPVTITNYERLHYFDPSAFAGVACDESSILKSFDGARRNAITDFMRKVPYRLLATATAAPNDYIELGTSSEALGYMGHMDMLGKFFRNERDNCATKRMYGEAPKFRLKGHAELAFWRWVTSWARAVRYPSDLGFEDGDFLLPPLIEVEHVIDTDSKPEGMLFNLPANNLFEQRDERRRTIVERCEKVASLVVDTGQPAMVWCHLNDEGNLLQKLIPGSIQIAGSDSDDVKEERLLAFASGKARVLITKPKIGAWGLNFQHCNHVVYFPSHSFEAYFQAVRRCWRFGQTRPVTVDIVLTEGERKVMDNLRRKATAADVMFATLVAEMNNALAIAKPDGFNVREEVPSWL